MRANVPTPTAATQFLRTRIGKVCVAIIGSSAAEMIEKAKKGGFSDFSFAYVANHQADQSINGKHIAEITQLKKQKTDSASQAEQAIEILLNGGAQMVLRKMSDDDVDRIMRHPQVSIASDSGVLAFGDGVPHPRGYGDNARVLGTYVRDRRVISLEEAIRKMTSLPAGHFRLASRGQVRAGYAADLVILNPVTVSDTATFEKPHGYATGIPYVLVNGVIVVKNGTQTDARPGQVIANSLLEKR